MKPRLPYARPTQKTSSSFPVTACTSAECTWRCAVETVSSAPETVAAAAASASCDARFAVARIELSWCPTSRNFCAWVSAAERRLPADGMTLEYPCGRDKDLRYLIAKTHSASGRVARATLSASSRVPSGSASTSSDATPDSDSSQPSRLLLHARQRGVSGRALRRA